MTGFGRRRGWGERPETFDTRFWLRVWPRGDCWEWRGHIMNTGYGSAELNGKAILAHRYAFLVARGELVKGLVLDHLCNHPWCVKPSHLVQTTQRRNALRGSAPTAANARKTCCPKCGGAYRAGITKSGMRYRRCDHCSSWPVRKLRQRYYPEIQAYRNRETGVPRPHQETP